MSLFRYNKQGKFILEKKNKPLPIVKKKPKPKPKPVEDVIDTLPDNKTIAGMSENEILTLLKEINKKVDDLIAKDEAVHEKTNPKWEVDIDNWVADYEASSEGKDEESVCRAIDEAVLNGELDEEEGEAIYNVFADRYFDKPEDFGK